MTAYRMTSDEITANMTFDKMTVAEIALDELSID